MSFMSEMHAEVHLATAAPATQAIRSALNEVTVRAMTAEGCDDLEAARKALREVTWAAIRAAEIINTIEREVRETALAQVGKAA